MKRVETKIYISYYVVYMSLLQEIDTMAINFEVAIGSIQPTTLTIIPTVELARGLPF
jgi:hypothetical protein